MIPGVFCLARSTRNQLSRFLNFHLDFNPIVEDQPVDQSINDLNDPFQPSAAVSVYGGK